MMAESAAYDPERSLEIKDALLALEVALTSLNPRHRAVLEARYGFQDAAPLQYNEIAKLFGFCVERGRQIEKKAIRDLYKYRKFIKKHCWTLVEK